MSDEINKLVMKLTKKFMKVLIDERNRTKNGEYPTRSEHCVKVDDIEVVLCFRPDMCEYCVGARNSKKKLVILPHQIELHNGLDELIDEDGSLECLMRIILKAFERGTNNNVELEII
ncbi:MAG: hypothetical protein V3V84_00635 [Candidatus Bathyarchaeia archaeon]